MLTHATGKKPVYMGKPKAEIVNYVRSLTKADGRDIVMVGDRFYTDMLMAVKRNMTSICLLSGEPPRHPLRNFLIQSILCSKTSPASSGHERNIMTTAIIIAGGSGKRMNSDIPKQFIEIEGRRLSSIPYWLSNDIPASTKSWSYASKIGWRNSGNTPKENFPSRSSSPWFPAEPPGN
jgi:hypothetical protein